MEIEVLDPGVDPEGNPAIQLERGPNGEQIVEIPPTILVHRYYYTGDRSFQAQMLRGGPVIIVVNHPKTGERVYIEATLPPGAPRVTYKQNKIIYDYDRHAATLEFGLLCAPKMTYRSGRTITQTASRAIHLEQIQDKSKKVAATTKQCATRAATSTAGAAIVAVDAAKSVVAPVVRLGANLPIIRTLTSSDLERRLAERVAQHKRDHQTKAVEFEKRQREWSIPTNYR